MANGGRATGWISFVMRNLGATRVISESPTHGATETTWSGHLTPTFPTTILSLNTLPATFLRRLVSTPRQKQMSPSWRPGGHSLVKRSTLRSISGKTNATAQTTRLTCLAKPSLGSPSHVPGAMITCSTRSIRRTTTLSPDSLRARATGRSATNPSR